MEILNQQQNRLQTASSQTEGHYQLSVQVKTEYLGLQSEFDEDNQEHMFSYTMTLKNTGTVAAKVLSRHWIITNALNKVSQIQGEGVVGKQPLIQPGESYEYTSGAVLDTPVGTMQGSYHLLAQDGQYFEAKIAPFTLAAPHSLH